MYLSSFRLGDHPERLVALLTDPIGPAAIIPNACDGYPADGRAEGVQREVDALRGLGVEARVLDLRDYFGQRVRLARQLQRYRMVWVRGGNTLLRYAMAASGADWCRARCLTPQALANSFGGNVVDPEGSVAGMTYAVCRMSAHRRSA